MTVQKPFSTLAVETHGPVRRILHDRPEVRNAESSVLLDQLDQALAEAEADPEIRVIILGGTGDHFSAGHDLKEAGERRQEFTVEERWDYETRRYFDYCLRIRDMPKPVIAQVQGACVAGGFMVANICDLIVAADDAFFADPVVHSLGAAAVELLIHPWVLGERRAKEFLFTGRRIEAEEAERCGLVNRVVPRAELEEATLAYAQHIAKAPAFALALTKRSINRTADIQGQRAALQAHFDTHQLSHVSEAFKTANAGGLAASLARSRKG